MRSLRSRLLCLMLVLVLAFSFAVPAFAASSITFLGLDEGFQFAPGSTYTETDLFESFKNVMPGDQLTETIPFTNESTDSDYIKLYMRAIAHDEAENPLSPAVAADGETVATMSEFLAQLSMRVYNGEELIYEASPDQLDGLAENVLLGSFRAGESTTLTVELDVPKTLDNRFAHRAGEVDWVFTAEGFDDPVPSKPDDTKVTVKKIWDDENDPNRPDSISVTLLRDGKAYDTVTLSSSNHWTYTWSKLDKHYEWTVAESNVPDGYQVSYAQSGSIIHITNTKENEPGPSAPTDLTVKKEWADTKDQAKNRPESVKVTLFNGTTAVETVVLGQWNQWTYTWEDLDGSGNWSVTEVEIPKGYTPIYSTNGTVVTITNSTIADTGLTQWPILLFGGAGLLFTAIGLCLIFKKRKNDHA